MTESIVNLATDPTVHGTRGMGQHSIRMRMESGHWIWIMGTQEQLWEWVDEVTLQVLKLSKPPVLVPHAPYATRGVRAD